MHYIGYKRKYTFDELVAYRSRLVAASARAGGRSKATKARIGKALLTGLELRENQGVLLDKWYVVLAYDDYGFYIRDEDGDRLYCLIQDCAVLGGDACNHESTEVYWEIEYV